MTNHRTVQRLHIWLGWAVAIPLLLWTISGLWMVARPIEEVRGDHLKRTAPPLVVPRALTAPITDDAIKTLAIETRPNGAVWVLTTPSGGARRADLASGRLLPPVARAEAVALARIAYAGTADVEQVTRTSADRPALELRRLRPAWRVGFGDGTNVYIDADTGSTLALRTRQWRAFDLMWGLHILDPVNREDTSHALLVLTALISVVGVATGTVLLFTRRRKRGRSGT